MMAAHLKLMTGHLKYFFKKIKKTHKIAARVKTDLSDLSNVLTQLHIVTPRTLRPYRRLINSFFFIL